MFQKVIKPHVGCRPGRLDGKDTNMLRLPRRWSGCHTMQLPAFISGMPDLTISDADSSLTRQVSMHSRPLNLR